MSMIKTIKRRCLQLSNGVGLSQYFLDSQWRRRRLLILCYHGISLEDEHEWNPALYMKLSTFESRLELLKKNRCSVLPLGEAIRRLYSNDLPERSVALTFDDGYYNFYKQAYPLLKAYELPATVYLTTFRCYNNKPNFRLLCSYMLWKKRGTVVADVDLLGSKLTLDLRTAAGREKAFNAITKDSSKLRLAGKDQLMEALADQLDLNYQEMAAKRLLNLMNPEEVAELSAAGVDFQLHTHTHQTPRDHASYQKEIDQNRDKIESAAGVSPVHFCYPSGIYHAQFVSWLSQEGMVSATTCDPGIASAKSNHLLLPRFVDTSHISPDEFEGWLTGLASMMAHRQARPAE